MKNRIYTKRLDGPGLRILINPKFMSHYINKKNAVLNPDVKHLKGVPLERLKIENGLIQKMTDMEYMVEAAKYKPLLVAKHTKRNWRLIFDVLILVFMVYSLRNEIISLGKLIGF